MIDLFEPPAIAADAVDLLQQRIAEVVEEDGGCWTACSGCQESDEGSVSEKLYPYSPIFRCQPGGGCGECGGIGVLWNDGAYLASWGEDLEPSAAEVATADVLKDADVAIWSGEHRAYWRRGSSGQGANYTLNLDEAGIWSRADAVRLTSHCGPEKMIVLHDRPAAHPSTQEGDRG